VPGAETATEGLTRTNVMLGTPSYMSPEQVRSSKHVDRRCDIWALGVILYEALTGRLPFDADNVTAVSAQIVMDSPPRPRQLRTDLPEALEAVVLRCLEKDPEARPASVAELSEALASFAPESARVSIERIQRLSRTETALGETVAAAPAASVPTLPMGGTAPGWGRTQGGPRRRNLAGAAVAAAAVLAAILALVLWPADRPEPEASPAAASAPATPVSAAAPSAPAETAQEPEPATEPAAASASAAEPEPTPTPPPPRARRSPAPPKKKEAECSPGQVLSQGHCCPIGHVWANGRCRRPLATDVPF